jgi:hypothetical protein
VADKASQLVLQALGRAAQDPAGLPLFSHKAKPGLFSATAAAKSAAQRCKEQDLLRVVRTEARGQAVQEVVAITSKGLDLLLNQASPGQVLEDLVRALEGRQKQLADLIATAQQAQGTLEAMKGLVGIVLERVQQSCNKGTAEELAARIMEILADWHAAHASKDCPLPDLFRALSESAPAVGTFHDALRHLQERQRIYLHPWTGPLYDLPEPALALLVGHEVAYYASLRP